MAAFLARVALIRCFAGETGNTTGVFFGGSLFLLLRGRWFVRSSSIC